mmetsp:Transcript_4605/g.15098  ORF Transcript_4605/g.15098 Transcript_4605/m.15098 type:complete len:438 (+) Transcript_4605:72-1385(+)
MASSAEQQVPSYLKRVVIDNGGHMCKVGFAGQPEPLRCMLNGVVRSKGATGKVYVGDQYDKCPDYSSLQYRRSLERGCLVNWDTQAEVWSRALGADVLNVNPADSSLLLTEIPMCPTAIQDTLDEMVFEHFGFHSYCTRSAPVLAALSIAAEQAKASGGGAPSPAALVVDAGFSATHCVPIFGSVALNYGIKRLNVGGKMLTNHLKQIVSYRAYNVMEETHLMNDVKERLCYLSLDFEADLALTRFRGKKNTIRREFVMPDYVHTTRGVIRDPHAAQPEPAPSPRDKDGAPAAKKGRGPADRADEQALSLSNERITVPELLFRPSDIGMEQAGVPECIAQSVEACLPDAREALYANILLTGGCSRFPNYEARLRRELRQLVPADFRIEVTAASDPTLAAWRGGSLFAASDDYDSAVVTKEQYREEGHALCRRRFAAA